MTWRHRDLLRAKGARAALLVALLATAGCGADIKQEISDASARIDRALGVDEQADAEAVQAAEETYRAGLSARQRGEEATAFARFLKAAEAGHGAAAYETGIAYKEARGTAQDLEEGARWINTAADRGEPRAQFLVGAAYYAGTGVAQDYDRAVKFLKAAAEQGHAHAQYLLAQAFANGHGVAKNRAWAARWYGKAAAQGLAEAQFHAGVAHASGLGVPASQVRGYAWLLLAARQGHGQAEEVRAALATKMSRDEIRRAEARADRVRPAAEPPFADPPTIIYVQSTLNALGFDAGPVDGVLGPRTRGAVGRYQQARGLPGDPDITPELLDRLLAEPGSGA